MSVQNESAHAPTEASSALAKLSEGIPSAVSNEVSTDSAFTPRLQLLHSQNKVRVTWDKERGPKPEEGNFWMGPPGDVFLGKVFACVPLAWRDHALRTKGDAVMLESFNAPPLGTLPRTPEESVFVEVKTAAAQKRKDSKDQQDRCGKDVLLWVPQQPQADPRWPGMPSGINGKFAVYFLAGTAVPEADNFRAAFFKKVTVRAKEVPGKSFVWYVPEVDLFERTGAMEPREVPNEAATKEELIKFLNPIAKGEQMPKTAAPGVDGASR